MKILENKHKLHGENFHQLIFTLVHNNLIVRCAFTYYWYIGSYVSCTRNYSLRYPMSLCCFSNVFMTYDMNQLFD